MKMTMTFVNLGLFVPIGLIRHIGLIRQIVKKSALSADMNAKFMAVDMKAPNVA